MDDATDSPLRDVYAARAALGDQGDLLVQVFVVTMVRKAKVMAQPRDRRWRSYPDRRVDDPGDLRRRLDQAALVEGILERVSHPLAQPTAAYAYEPRVALACLLAATDEWHTSLSRQLSVADRTRQLLRLEVSSTSTHQTAAGVLFPDSAEES